MERADDSNAEGASFKDKWETYDVDKQLDRNLSGWSIPLLYQMLKAVWRSMLKSDISYLTYMSIRIIEMRRILKATGSLYYHIDGTMAHYIKIVLEVYSGVIILGTI